MSRSTIGFCVFLGHSWVPWNSGKQRMVSMSSTEVEFRALAYVTVEVSWIHNYSKKFMLLYLNQ